MLTRLGRQEHAGVVRVLDSGIDGGLLWYAMEFVDGFDLSAFMQLLWKSAAEDQPRSRTTISPATVVLEQRDGRAAAPVRPAAAKPAQSRQAAAGQLGGVARLAAEIAETLAFLHGEGVVHCDLKPSNVLLRSDGHPVLVDFGTALRTFTDGVSREIAQVEGRVHGTPGYMAPEQLRGESLDARCDLYAFGCVLYELVTGQPPFDADGVIALRRMHLHLDPMPPSSRVEGVPPELDTLILRLLEKDPSRRMGHAEEAGEILRRFSGPLVSRPQPRPATVRLYRPRLVGRARAIQALGSRLRAAVEGRGGCLLVTGESGVGKTRMVNDLGSRAIAERMEVVAGRCFEVVGEEAATRLRGSALEPFGSFLRMLADRCHVPGGGALAASLAPEMAALAPYEAALLTVPGVSDQRLPALPPDLARRRILRSLSTALRVFAEQRGLLLVLDDVQWADDLTLEFLRSAARESLAASRVLIAATARDEQLDESLRDLIKAQGPACVRLEPIGPDDVREMIKDMLASTIAPAGLAEFLHQQSDGNPFFVAEYLRAAVERSVVRRGPMGGWTIPDPAAVASNARAHTALPASLQGLLELRLEGLGPSATNTLELAAILGRDFSVDLLDAFMAGSAPDALSATSVGLHELVTRQILEEGDSGRYRFVHDKLREARLQTIAPDRRRELSRAAATLLEASAGDTEHQDAALGSHWAQAGEPARAFECLQRAARRAESTHAYNQAVELYRLALIQGAAAGPLNGPHAERLAALGETVADLLARIARHAEAREQFDQTFVATPPANRLARARLTRKKAQSYLTAHQYPEALATLEQADGLLGPLGDLASPEERQEWIEIQQGCFSVHYFARRAGDETQRIIDTMSGAVETHGTRSQRSFFLQCLAQHLLGQGHYRYSAQAVELARRSVDLLEGTESMAERNAARAALAFGLVLGGPAECHEAVALLAAAAKDASAMGDTGLEARALTYLAVATRRTCDVSGTVASSEKALRAAELAQLPQYAGAAAACLAWTSWKSGDLAQARERVQDAHQWWKLASHVFPFRWLANMVSLELASVTGDLRHVGDPLENLTSEQQQALPEDLESALRAVPRVREGEAQPTLRNALAAALSLARHHRYL